MRFSNLIAAVAISTLAVTASAQNDQQQPAATTAKEVNININTNAQQASQQPATTVEAAPAALSKAEAMRKARQDAEVQTEQKIVEKLEDSRLQEEKARADRLFGNKLDDKDKQAAPAAAVVVAPVAAAPAPAPENKPAQVTIEKVEIVQPAPAPVAENKIDAKGELAPPSVSKYYVSGVAGNMSYGASNVKSNYALGVAVGTIIDDKWGVELAYLYSNHNVDDIWPGGPLYHRLDQSDFQGSARYYILPGKLKPYVGASVTYINRKYTQRMYNYPYSLPQYYGNNAENTSAVDAGILGGVDFAINDSFSLGAGADYNFNMMNISDFNNQAYGLPPGFTPLEKISYWTLKLTAKFTF